MSADNVNYLDIGHGVADVTPKRNMRMAGFGSRGDKPSEGVYQRICVRALTLNDGVNRVVFLGADLVAWANPMVDRIRALLKEKHGLAPAQIILNATHTHCGPDIRNEEAYADEVVLQAVALVDACFATAQPGRVYFGRGKAAFSVNRRGKTKSGGFYRVFNPYGPIDDEVTVLKAVDQTGKVIAVLMNYACHNTAIAGFLMGGDWAGYASRFVEEEHPEATALFIQGAGGDVKPNNLAAGTSYKMGYEGGPERAAKYGWILADAVLAVLKGNMKEITGAIACNMQVVQLPLLETVEDNEPLFVGPTRRMARLARQLLSSIDENGNYLKTKSCEVFLTRIGPEFLFLASNGELAVRIGLRIKSQLIPLPVMVAGYTGQSLGYIPSMDMIPEKGYEARTPYSLEMEDMLIGALMDMVPFSEEELQQMALSYPAQ